MIAGSLFTGIGGFDLGFERAGFEIAYQVENDPACNKVLDRRFPGVKRYGDITNVKRLPTTSVVFGGFPCQDLSIAGKRQGLSGSRSGLWWEFYRIVEQSRPDWVVIENVPGLLSSNGGQDLAILGGSLVQLGYAVCWRVLDSQYFGVAQRRRRVFVVASLGDGRCGEVLFDSKGGAWDFAESGETRQDITGTLDQKSASAHRGSQWSEESFLAYDIQTNDGGQHKRKDRPNGGMYVNQVDKTLTLGSSDQTLIAHPDPAYALADSSGSRTGSGRDRQDTFIYQWASGGGNDPKDTAQALRSSPETNYQILNNRGFVRRLTPVECERLQGFPDNWTDEQPDAHRYKQLGNAVTVPVAEFIARQIRRYIT